MIQVHSHVSNYKLPQNLCKEVSPSTLAIFAIEIIAMAELIISSQSVSQSPVIRINKNPLPT